MTDSGASGACSRPPGCCFLLSSRIPSLLSVVAMFAVILRSKAANECNILSTAEPTIWVSPYWR